ncbi:MAG: sulfite exporter TauE/SafE family protein [Lautropia sp.]
MDLPELVLLVPVICLAGWVRGVTGFGGPLILVPVLGFFYGPISAISTSMLVDLSCNVGLLRTAWRHASRRVAASLIGGAIPTIPIGGYMLLEFPPTVIARIVYVLIGIFAIVLLLGWRASTQLSPRQFFLVGTLNGVIVGATSLGAAALPFLFSGHESALRSRATFIVWALFSALVGLTVVLVGGRVGASECWRALVLMPAYLIGTTAGNRFAGSVDDRLLRRIVLIVLLAMAVVGVVLNMR